MRYKAIFFDRDNTLAHGDPAVAARRNALFLEWTGKPYAWDDYDQLTADFKESGYPNEYFLAHRDDEAACVRAERAFLRRYYALRLRRAGLTEGVAEKADELHEITWLKKLIPYPETIRTLEWFRARGYRMGVISDTSPSLRLTIEAAGLARYFDSYTCADIVGAMKPEPVIYRTALASLGVAPEESLYVDDYVVESDGARKLGMTAFHILREGLDPGYEGEREWDIHSLYEIVEFAERNG